MPLSQTLLPEFETPMADTHRVLEQIPDEIGGDARERRAGQRDCATRAEDADDFEAIEKMFCREVCVLSFCTGGLA